MADSILGITFKDPALLEQALTHRSYINEHPDVHLDNERLEFLGDAVLDFIVGAYLYHHYPEQPEGELTTLRAAVVRADSLADFARSVDMGAQLRLGYGESESGGRDKTPTLCAAFEAVIGAIYLDQGIGAVEQVVEPFLEPTLKTIIEQRLHKDAKSEFQVWAQANHGVTPHYELIQEDGPDHAKQFTLQVKIGETVWGVGSGRSKQIAAQAAARIGLDAALATPVK